MNLVMSLKPHGGWKRSAKAADRALWVLVSAMADAALAQMHALFNAALNSMPEETARQFREQAAAVRVAEDNRRAEEAEQAADAADEETDRANKRANKLLMSRANQSNLIRALLHLAEKTSRKQAERLLELARTAFDDLLKDAQPGESREKLSSVRGVVHELVSNLPKNGPIGKKRYERLRCALEKELQLQPPEDDDEVDEHLLVRWQPEDDGDADQDEGDESAMIAIVRPQKTPSDFNGTHPLVAQVRPSVMPNPNPNPNQATNELFLPRRRRLTSSWLFQRCAGPSASSSSLFFSACTSTL